MATIAKGKIPPNHATSAKISTPSQEISVAEQEHVGVHSAHPDPYPGGEGLATTSVKTLPPTFSFWR